MATTDFYIIGLPPFPFTGSPDAAMTKANAATREPSEKFRSASLSPVDTMATPASSYYSTLAWQYYLNGVALIGHSCRWDLSGKCQPYARVAFSPDATIALQYEEIAPSAVSSSSGLTNDETYVDDDPYVDDPADTDYITLAAGGWVIFDFPTPTTTPVESTDQDGNAVDTQIFTVKADYNAQLKISVYESGIGELDFRSVSGSLGTSGQARVEYLWDPSGLTARDGSNVQIRIENLSGSTPVNVYAVRWFSEFAKIGGAYDDPYLLDTGWIWLSNSPYWESVELGVAARYRNSVLYVDPADLTVSGSGCPGAVSVILNGNNPDGYVDLGCVYAGQSFRSALNIDYGKLTSWWDPSFKDFTHGGQTYGTRRAPLWKPRISLSNMTSGEASSLLGQLKNLGVLSPLVVALMPETHSFDEMLTAYCTVDASEIELSSQFYDSYEMEVPFVEKR